MPLTPSKHLPNSGFDAASLQPFVQAFLDYLEERHQLPREAVRHFIEQTPREPYVPLSIFAQDRLTVLEALCLYLHENLGLSFGQMAALLGRSSRHMSATYSRATVKAAPVNLPPVPSISVPASIFANRSLGPLESLVVFLREHHRLTFRGIARLLHRDDSTIWTSYQRARSKT